MLSKARVTSKLTKLPQTDHSNQDGFYTRGSVREIGVFFEILRLSHIDAPTSTFDVQFELQLTWLPTHKELKAFRKNQEEYKPDFIPVYNWTNADHIKLEMDSTGYQILEHGGVDTWGNRVKLIVPFVNAVLFTGSGTFFATFMNLRHFPFDVLDLPIELECQQNIGSVVFVPSFDIGSRVVDVTENCRLLNPAFLTHEPLAEVVVKECDAAEYCSFIVRLKCERNWHAHSDIYVAMCSLSLCAMTVFIQDFGSRLENLFTILLTVTAYTHVIKSTCPKIAYYTKVCLHKTCLSAGVYTKRVSEQPDRLLRVCMLHLRHAARRRDGRRR